MEVESAVVAPMVVIVVKDELVESTVVRQEREAAVAESAVEEGMEVPVATAVREMASRRG